MDATGRPIIRRKENKTLDRILILRPIEGKSAKRDTGLTDNTLFTGANRLHAVQNPQNGLWSLKYDSGLIPPALKMQFTNFNILMTYVTEYFKRRNISVREDG